MKKLLLLFFGFVLMAFAVQQPAGSETTTTSVSFSFPKDNVAGTVSGFKGLVALNHENPSQSKVYGQVDAATLATGIWLRNAHLRTGNYFGVSKFPLMKFEAASVTLSNGKFMATGPLAIKEKVQTVTFTFEKVGNGLVGTATIFSSDFGIAIHKNRADNRVDIKIEVAGR